MWLVPRHRFPQGPRTLFWLVPAACVGVAIMLAVGLVFVNHEFNVDSPILFQGPPSGARTSLSSIITAMISLTGLVFSVTFVALQLTAAQSSPRVLQVFLRDRIIQTTFGVFVATSIYALVVLQTIKGDSSNADVPRLAVSVAFVLVFISTGVLTLYMGHVAHMLRLSSLIAEITHETRKVLDQYYPTESRLPADRDELPPPTRVIRASRPGLLTEVNEKALAKQAARAGCVLVLEHRMGDYVPEGAPLFTVHGEAHDVERLVAKACKNMGLGAERTPEQDLAFGFRQLVDIADRALSQSTNDPTTASRSLDALHSLLRQFSMRTQASDAVYGPDGEVRLVIPRYGFTDMLDMTVGEVWAYGSDSVQVPERLERMLVDLMDVACPEYRDSVDHWLKVVRE